MTKADAGRIGGLANREATANLQLLDDNNLVNVFLEALISQTEAAEIVGMTKQGVNEVLSKIDRTGENGQDFTPPLTLADMGLDKKTSKLAQVINRHGTHKKPLLR